MIDLAALKYDVELITENGDAYILNDALSGVTWEEHQGEIAQRANLSTMNFKIETSYLMSLTKLNCVILIYSIIEDNRQLVFQGNIWEWDYTSAQNKNLTIIAYDDFKKLQQNRDFEYITAGLDTKSIVNKICGDRGVPVSYDWSVNITHEKKVFQRQTIAEMILTILNEASKQSGLKHAAYWKDGKLKITNYGGNKKVYTLKYDNSVSTRDKLTMDNLVTKVKVIGVEDSDERRQVEAVVDGNLDFGVLQEIVVRDSDKTLAQAQAEANTILKERGKPDETIGYEGPDIPELRKGDLVELGAGNLIGEFYIEDVTHNATEKRMSLQLSRNP
jgi:hypothetical protein